MGIYLEKWKRADREFKSQKILRVGQRVALQDLIAITLGIPTCDFTRVNNWNRFQFILSNQLACFELASNSCFALVQLLICDRTFIILYFLLICDHNWNHALLSFLGFSVKDNPPETMICHSVERLYSRVCNYFFEFFRHLEWLFRDDLDLIRLFHEQDTLAHVSKIKPYTNWSLLANCFKFPSHSKFDLVPVAFSVLRVAFDDLL